MRQHVMPTLALDRAGPQPLSGQLAAQLRDAVAMKVLRPGERLPSSRVLAAHLAVSRIVVTEAYERLISEGWLEGQHGSGTFVTRGPVPAEAADPVPGPVGGGPASTTAQGRKPIDLRSGKPWVTNFDQAAWRRAWRSAGGLAPADDPDPYGSADLRVQLTEHLRRSRAVPFRADHLLVTRGTGNGLDILAATVIRPGDRVGVEDPGYQVAGQILAARGAEVVPVPVDGHGVVVETLPDDLSLLYMTPAHQFPLGGRLPPGRRRALIAWARRNGTLLVEDDYDAEFRYDVAPLPTLYSQAPDRVVLIGTLSKSVSPDVGLGWLVAPPDLLGRIASRRENLTDRTPGAVQRAVTTLIASGDLDRHLRRMRQEYTRRREVIIDELGELVSGEAAGLHVMVELPAVAAANAVTAAAERGVLLETTQRHSAGPPRRHGLVLGYGSADLSEVRTGCRILRDILRAEDVEVVCEDPRPVDMDPSASTT